MILLTSCSKPTLNQIKEKESTVIPVENKENLLTEDQHNFNFHISKPHEQTYSVYKKIENLETINSILNVLNQISWEEAEVDMTRQPDFKITVVNINPTAYFNPIIFDLWITPNKDKLEIIIEGRSKYQKLSKQDSAILLDIIQTP